MFRMLQNTSSNVTVTTIAKKIIYLKINRGTELIFPVADTFGGN